MVVVPRLFEVLRARILKAVEKQGKFAAYLLRQALRIGGKSYAGNLPLWDRPVRLLVDRTLAPKIQQRFGGRIKAMVSGGAPLNPDIGIFFHRSEEHTYELQSLMRTSYAVLCLKK